VLSSAPLCFIFLIVFFIFVLLFFISPAFQRFAIGNLGFAAFAFVLIDFFFQVDFVAQALGQHHSAATGHHAVQQQILSPL
jgi:hypothetical protein